MKESCIAINTPAVHDCLGWKIGEFLALQKTILSLPINRIMPGKFVAGEHYHQFINVKEDFEKELVFLIDNEEYMDKLSHNANQYYEEYLTPKSVISRIHKNFFLKV